MFVGAMTRQRFNMQGPTVTCDECNSTIPAGAKFRQTAVEIGYQKVVDIRIGVSHVLNRDEHKETAFFDLCGDRCLLKHISRLLNQGA